MNEPSLCPSNPTVVIPFPGLAQPQRIHLDELGSIFLRGRVWWIEFWEEGVQHRESSRSQNEKEARKLLKQRRAELARDEFINPRNDRLLVKEFLDAVKLDYKLAGNRSQDTLAFRLAPLLDAFGHMRASKVSTSMIETYKGKRLSAGKARATCNRELAVLKRAYTLAVEQKRISIGKVPTITLLPEDNARQGFVDYEDFTALVGHLPVPLDDVARFAYSSGWRRGEILSLEWRDVDQDAGLVTLRAELSKNKEPRELPLTPALREVIDRRWDARLVTVKGDEPTVSDRVFHRDGQAICDFRDPWAAACNAIGRPGLLFHDLRRSAVRNFVNAGVPERVAMKITGHKTRAVFDRYHIVSNRDVRDALARAEAAMVSQAAKTAEGR